MCSQQNRYTNRQNKRNWNLHTRVRLYPAGVVELLSINLSVSHTVLSSFQWKIKNVTHRPPLVFYLLKCCRVHIVWIYLQSRVITDIECLCNNPIPYTTTNWWFQDILYFHLTDVDSVPKPRKPVILVLSVVCWTNLAIILIVFYVLDGVLYATASLRWRSKCPLRHKTI